MDAADQSKAELKKLYDKSSEHFDLVTGGLSWRYLIQVLVLTALYFIAGRLALLLAIPPGYASAVSPASGIALAALLMIGYRLWPGILLGAFLVNIGISFDVSDAIPFFKSLALAISISVGATLQAVAGAFLVYHFVGFPNTLTRSNEIIKLLILGGPVSCLIGATGGAYSLLIGGAIPWSDYSFTWWTWWGGDTIGVLIVTPLALIWTGKPRKVWRHRLVSVTMPFCVTLLGVAMLFIHASARERERIKLEFERQAVIVANSLERNLDRYLDVLYALESFYAGSQNVTRQEFSQFTKYHLSRYQGIQALSWNPRVLHEERAAHEKRAWQDGYVNFRFRERDEGSALIRASRRPVYFPIYFIEPYHGNEEALGFDVASNAACLDALKRARDAGVPIATAQIGLIQQSGDKQPGILVFLPIYRNSSTPENTVERRQDLQGYVVEVFRIGDLLKASADDLGITNIEARLYDKSAPQKDHLLYAYRSGDKETGRATLEDEPAANPTELYWTTAYSFAGRQWSLRLSPTIEYFATHRTWTAWAVLASGLLFTGLLGAFQLILGGRAVALSVANVDLQREIAERKRAQEEIARLGRDLKRRLDELQALFDVAPVGIAVAQDTDCRHITINPAGAAMLGANSGENISKSGPDADHLLFRVLHNGRELAPQDLPMQYAAAQDVLIRDLELDIVHEDGRVLTLFEYASPLHDEHGNVRGCLGVFVDITERKQAEQALFAEKERAQVTLHSIGDAVITTNAHGIVEYLNPVAEALTGWPVTEAQGQPLEVVFQIIAEQSRERIPDPVMQCLKESRVIGLTDHPILLSRHGQEYAIQDSAAPIRDRAGRVLGAVLVFHDVSEARRTAQKIAYDATHDALTGLVNRREFEQRLTHAVASSKEYDARHALCYLDLDQFKIVNDTVGHVAGDELLKQITVLLKDGVRERDTLARLGGDEFGLLLSNCPLNKALEIAEVLVAAVRDFRFVWEGRTFPIGVSIGLVPITAEAENATQLLSQADVACYTAKDLGRNRVHVYQLEDGEPVRRHFEIHQVSELRDALEKGRFCLYGQPIICLSPSSDVPTGYELLLRLLDARGEIVVPGAFIPSAERYGLMGDIDRWVIQTAFRRYSELFGSASGPAISINLSGGSLSDESLLQFVQQQLADFVVAPDRICFEITETAAIYNFSRATRFITELKNIGCCFALDDFGSGLSSFTYLKKLPVDFLKIDGSFVQNMVDNLNDHAMVAAINQVGRTMGIRTIAEHADSEAILDQLRDLGVNYAQGYVLGSPRPLEEIAWYPQESYPAFSSPWRSGF